MKHIFNKTNLFKSLATIIFGFALVSGIQAQTKLAKITLNDAIRKTVNNHPLIEEAKSQLAIAIAKTAEQKSLFAPMVNANLSYTRMGPVPEITFPMNGQDVNFRMASPDNFNENIAVNYLVYDFKRRQSVLELYKSNELAEAEKIAMIKDRLAYETAQVFYSLVYLQKSIQVINLQQKDVIEHLDIAHKKVRTGTAIALDTLSTSVKLLVLNNQRLSLKNQWVKTTVVLKSLMGIDQNTNIQLEGDIYETNEHYQSDSLIQLAYSQREELRLNNLLIQSQQIQYTLAQKTNTPTLSLHGSAGFKNGYPTELEKLKANYVVGVAASIPIYNGKLKKLKTNTASLNIESSLKHANVLKNEIKTDVEKTLLDYQNNFILLNSAKKEIEMANAAYEQAKKLYKTGVITNTTLLDTQTSVAEARLKQTFQQYQLIVSQYALMQATGTRIWE